ncbi:MAG: hypothetical protein JRJ85_15675 [Deltaproteobacteria bacterium]|nr:hypothetical protein [Deltaproteobacteria bacterium]
MKKNLIIVALLSFLLSPSVYAGYGIDEYTKLLIHSNTTDGNTVFADSSFIPHTITSLGNVNHSTAKAKFGSSAIYFDGSGDYLQIPDSEDWHFGNEDFTIDFWVNFQSAGAEHAYFLGQKTDDWNYWIAELYNGNLGWGYGSTEYDSGAWSPSADTWYHVAWVATDGGTHLKSYVDGHQIGTEVSIPNVDDFDLALTIGQSHNYHFLKGYLDEIRISKGIARWTSDFTPPSEPYGTVPIPGALWLLGSGLVGLIGFRRKLKK